MSSDPFLPAPVRARLLDRGLTPDGALVTTRSSWILPVTGDPGPAMLKVARIPDEQAGYRLMSWWAGSGAARVLAASEGVLLLERATGPGSLSRMAREGQDDEACRILCRTAHELHAARDEAAPELHALEDWFQPLFDLAGRHPALARSARVARDLMADPRDIRPLHGDLHHDNVLDYAERGWLAIDPHGLIGERGFDFANIFTNPDLSDPVPAVATRPERLDARLEIVSREADLEPRRLLQWIIAWTGLSAAWFIGDADDAGALIDLEVNALAAACLDLRA